MRSRPEETLGKPALYAFADAWASSVRVCDISSFLQALTRGWFACFERYAVATVDVLVHGADPYVGLVAAWRAAQHGKRVLLSFTSEMDVDAANYRLNALRTIHLPPEIEEYLRAQIGNVGDGGTGYSSVLTGLCNLVMSMRNDEGQPLVHVSRASGLSPDSGVCQNYPDSHIFWPIFGGVSSRDASAEDLRVIHRFVARRIRPYRIDFGRMTVGYVRVRHLVITSHVPGYTHIPWHCRVTRLGAATRRLSDSDTSDHTLRQQDIAAALAFASGCTRGA